MVMSAIGRYRLIDFFRAFIGKVSTADAEQVYDRIRSEPVEEQIKREQYQFVQQRTGCDLADHRQFSLGLQADNIAWRNGVVVDDNTSRLDTGFARLCDYVIQGSCSQLTRAATSSSVARRPKAILLQFPYIRPKWALRDCM
jgi:hypothetical protein